jgi:hypothetical protein
MDTAAEFRKHAVNCNRMAKVSKDPETKGIWRHNDGFCAPVGRRRRAISSAASRAKS